MVVPSTKKKQMSLRSNLISLLLGISFAYLIMQNNVCPLKEDCNCEHLINETTLHQAAETVSEKSSAAVVSKEKSFYDIGLSYGTDKVQGPTQFGTCLKDEARCVRPGCVQKECRPWGHWYHTLYQQRLGKYSLEETEPFQFMEIGFYTGRGYQAYRDFFAATAEVHSMEISCGPKEKVSRIAGGAEIFFTNVSLTVCCLFCFSGLGVTLQKRTKTTSSTWMRSVFIVAMLPILSF